MVHGWLGSGLDVGLLDGGGLTGEEAFRTRVRCENVGLPSDCLDDARLQVSGSPGYTWGAGRA